MVTVIHGDDTAKSREYYLTERSKHTGRIILDGTTLTFTDFLQAIGSSGLFGDQQTIFIEDLLSKRKPSKDLDAIINVLLTTSNQRLATMFLYESKELTKTQLKPFTEGTIKQFSIPKTVFAFLDSILPNNGKKSTSLFHDFMKDEDANFALFMFQRQVRILLTLASVIASETKQSHSPFITEVSRLAPWQKGKLQKQANAFTQNALLYLHEQLYHLELGQKTGQLSQSLDQAIDFLLLSM